MWSPHINPHQGLSELSSSLHWYGASSSVKDKKFFHNSTEMNQPLPPSNPCSISKSQVGHCRATSNTSSITIFMTNTTASQSWPWCSRSLVQSWNSDPTSTLGATHTLECQRGWIGKLNVYLHRTQCSNAPLPFTISGIRGIQLWDDLNKTQCLITQYIRYLGFQKKWIVIPKTRKISNGIII